MDELKKHDLAEADYIAGMKYKDIAVKYEVSINTVKSWKKRYMWERANATKKVAPEKTKKVATTKDVTKEEPKDEDDLTDKQELFCIYYVKSFNAVKAYQKVYSVSYGVAAACASRLLNNAKIKDKISQLKTSKITKANLEPEDIIQKYIDIAFADLGDYVEIGTEEVFSFDDGKIITDNDGKPLKILTNYMHFKDSSELDLSAISEVSFGKSDKIKLHDKFKALSALREILGDSASQETKNTLEILMEQFNNGSKY